MFNEIRDELPIIVENLPSDIEKGRTYIINQTCPNNFTHSYFKYPCKFIPEIPRWAINTYLKEENGVVYDPFSGSGTTLLEAIINHHSAVGTEIDPIAKLIIKVKTTKLSSEEILLVDNYLEEILDKLSAKQKPNIIYNNINNIYHWFPEETVELLSLLKQEVEEIENNNVSDFLKLCFVSIIRRVSYADDVSPKPYVSNRIKKVPGNVADEFQKVVQKYLDDMRSFSNSSVQHSAVIVEGDALNAPKNIEVDLIVTSPPYINAFDYARTLRLENLWLSYATEDELRERKKKYVGTESLNVKCEEENLEILNDSELLRTYFNNILEVDKKRAMIVKRFFEDMKKNIIEMHSILKNEGRYCIVIGNSNIRGVEIESWKVLSEIGEKVGFSTETYFNYLIQNHRLRIPRGGKGGKINNDHILVLKKRRDV